MGSARAVASARASAEYARPGARVDMSRGYAAPDPKSPWPARRERAARCETAAAFSTVYPGGVADIFEHTMINALAPRRRFTRGIPLLSILIVGCARIG